MDFPRTTMTERDLLRVIALRPNGSLVRGETEKQLVLGLAMKRLVTDAHEMPCGAYYTRITDEGKAELRLFNPQD